MKKLSILCLAFIGLTGCTTETIKVVEKPADTYVKESSEDKVDTYFQAVLDGFPDSVNIHGRKWIVDFGTIACDAIDEGMTLKDLIGMVPAGSDGAFIGYMLRQAIINICPHNQWFIDAASGATT